jgi:hypothetical protein
VAGRADRRLNVQNDRTVRKVNRRLVGLFHRPRESARPSRYNEGNRVVARYEDIKPARSDGTVFF